MGELPSFPVADLVYLLFMFLTVVLLMALLAPPPSRAPAGESGVHVALLCAGCLATILTGAMALANFAAAAAVCGVAAWLLVMPCVWLARAPQLDEGWEEEEEDDDGGSPQPLWPSAPPAPDDRPDFGPSSLAPAGSLWAPVRAPVLVPVASAAALAEELAPACAAGDPEPAHRRRLAPPPRRVRGDHRSIVHIQAAGPHATGRRRRASLRRRFLRTCRRVFWFEAPECADAAPPAHDVRLRGPRLDSRQRDDESHSARF